MIVAKKSYNTINYLGYDNYAYDYKRYTENEDKKVNNNTKVKHKPDIRKKVKLLFSVMLMLFVGMLIVGRYAVIMELNNQSLDLQNTISENKKINDDLNLQLLKNCDIKQIEGYATSEIKMVRPDLHNIIHINVARINKDDKVAKQDGKPKQISLLGEIISFFE